MNEVFAMFKDAPTPASSPSSPSPVVLHVRHDREHSDQKLPQLWVHLLDAMKKDQCDPMRIDATSVRINTGLVHTDVRLGRIYILCGPMRPYAHQYRADPEGIYMRINAGPMRKQRKHYNLVVNFVQLSPS
jgi:hypothetical protein